MGGIFNQPRMRLLANGVALPVLRADIRQTGYYGASKFSATLAVFGDAALWAELFGPGAIPTMWNCKVGFWQPGRPKGPRPGSHSSWGRPMRNWRSISTAARFCCRDGITPAS